MTRDEVVDRFLLVGYQRRIGQPGPTPGKGRSPMGRKGIGKLSLFSIANVITVETIRDDEKTALRMRLDAVRAAIEHNRGRVPAGRTGGPPNSTTHTARASHSSQLRKTSDRQHRRRVAQASGETILDHRSETRFFDHRQP